MTMTETMTARARVRAEIAEQVASQDCYDASATDKLTNALCTIFEIVRAGHDNTGGTDHLLVINELTRGALAAYRDEATV